MREPLPFNAMYSGIISEWFSAYRVTRRNFADRFKNSRFGLLWEFLDPLLLALIFVTLHKYRGITAEPNGMSYPIFVVTGLLLWQTFIDGLFSGTKAITSQKHLLKAVHIKPELIVLSTLYTVMFSSVFRLIIAVSAGLILLDASMPNVIGFCLGFVYIALLGLGVGMIISPFATVNGDIRYLVSIIARPMMFVSAVIFPFPDGDIFNILRAMNPIAVSIENTRQFLVSGTFSDSNLVILMFMTIVPIVFCLGWYTLHVTLAIVGDQK